MLIILVFYVFITTSCLVSTSITLHAPLILITCPFLLEKIFCGWLLGNREKPISIFSSKMDIFSILMVHSKLLMLIQDVKL